MRMLIVDKDPAARSELRRLLGSRQYDFDEARSAYEGEKLGSSGKYDLMLLELDMGDGSGLRVLRSLRAANIFLPVIVVAWSSAVADKVRALDQGADDYVTKPYDDSELLARVRAVTRRSSRYAHSLVRLGNLCVDLPRHRVTVENKKVNLSDKEYRALQLLVLNVGQLVTRRTFFAELYPGTAKPKSRTLDVFIWRLRNKFAVNGKNYIETIKGQGYILCDPDEP